MFGLQHWLCSTSRPINTERFYVAQIACIYSDIYSEFPLITFTRQNEGFPGPWSSSEDSK